MSKLLKLLNQLLQKRELITYPFSFLQKVAVEISSVTVTCSDEEKNALKEEQASLSSAEESLVSALDSVMADLEGKYAKKLGLLFIKECYSCNWDNSINCCSS